MSNTPTFSEKMANYKGAFSARDEVEVVSNIPTEPESKPLQPAKNDKESTSVSSTKYKNDKLVSTPEATSQKYLEFVPTTARLKDEHVDFLTRIKRKINQERRMNASSVRGLKRERITDQSILRALLDVCMTQIREDSFENEVVLSEDDLKLIIKRKFALKTPSLQ